MRQSNLFTAALLMLIILIVSFASASAQKSSDLKGDLAKFKEGDRIYINMRDGSTLVGNYISTEQEAVIIETDLGELTVPYLKIEYLSSSKIESNENSEWFSNPNQSRLLFAPNGRSPKKGQGYFTDILIFLPSITYAVTDNFSMGAGMSIFPGIDLDDQLLIFTPKIGFKTSGKFHFALGSFIMRFPDDLDFDSDDKAIWLGMLMGMATYGSEDHSLTFGLGHGFVDDELAEKPMVVIGGETRIARKISLISENWVLPGTDGGLISAGFRFFGKGMAIDLAMMSAIDTDEGDSSPLFPYLDFVFFF